MARIGTFEVQIYIGLLREPQRGKRIHRREGVNGTGVLLGSFVSEVSQVHTEATVASEAAARSLANAYRGIDGTLVSVVDGHGVEHRQVMVMGVRTSYFKALGIVGGAGANDTHVVEAEWDLLPPYLQQQQGAS